MPVLSKGNLKIDHTYIRGTGSAGNSDSQLGQCPSPVACAQRVTERSLSSAGNQPFRLWRNNLLAWGFTAIFVRTGPVGHSLV